MAQKKAYRGDNTYMISTDKGENPKLGARVMSDGRESLFLDYYFGYTRTMSATGNVAVRVDRKREYLHLYLQHAPATAQERYENKETLRLAREIRYERGLQLSQDVNGYRARIKSDIELLPFFDEYLARYTKRDVRMVRLAFSRFRDFLAATPEYNKHGEHIKPSHLTHDMMEDFTDYLQHRSKGQGAQTIYKRFKKAIKYLVEHDMLSCDPCRGITINVDENILTKEVLSQEEMERLILTHYHGESREVRRAFIFCLYTGLRYCDVRDLTFGNIDYANRLLKFEQNKTRGHSSASGVVIPLTVELVSLLGDGDKEQRVFALPSYEACLQCLKTWVRRAGIDKHISWHCARHSFATNILTNGANIKTVASLLGHSSLRYTEKYTRAVDSLKQEAINSLPKLNVNKELL